MRGIYPDSGGLIWKCAFQHWMDGIRVVYDLQTWLNVAVLHPLETYRGRSASGHTLYLKTTVADERE